jgi:hypothetical protein
MYPDFEISPFGRNDKICHAHDYDTGSFAGMTNKRAAAYKASVYGKGGEGGLWRERRLCDGRRDIVREKGAGKGAAGEDGD